MGYLHYKGYTGVIEYDEDLNIFVGHVTGLNKDGISFEGDSIDALTQDFQDGIDDYLDHCQQIGKKPEKPYSGKTVIRIGPDLHMAAALKARNEGISLNEFINKAIEAAVL